MTHRGSIRVHGWDLSLNHSGFVQLDDGELTNFWYLTDLAGSAARSKKHGVRLKVKPYRDRQVFAMQRLDRLRAVTQAIIRVAKPDFVGIEDYALDSGHGAHFMGEFGGIARAQLWEAGIPFRLHDPVSVKMFATYNGNADKDFVRECVEERWGPDFSRFDQPLAKPTVRTPEPQQNTQTSEDLCDAMAVAQLVWAEVQLRAGHLTMADLEHDKERQVFNRVTKAYPVNLLDREWISDEG